MRPRTSPDEAAAFFVRMAINSGALIMPAIVAPSFREIAHLFDENKTKTTPMPLTRRQTVLPR
jgi:hypothetical protein